MNRSCDCCAYNGECVFWHMYEEMVKEIMGRFGAPELYKDYVKAYRPEYRPNCCTCREGVEKNGCTDPDRGPEDD